MVELNKAESVWNMGLASSMRMHQDILEYKTAYINSDPPLMYKVVFSLYLELQSEFNKDENEKATTLISTCKQSLTTFNQFNNNIVRNSQKYPHRKQNLPQQVLKVYNDINDFFLHVKMVMKRLDIHLPKRETDPSTIFGGTD